MQKYRKWTDQSTGINPFIKAKTSPLKLYSIVISAIIAFLKINLITLLLPLFLIGLYTFNKVKSPAFLSIPIVLLNNLLGLWGVDDQNFQRWITKNNSKPKVILSNSVSVLDALYYMRKLKPVKFIVSSPEQQKFQAIGGMTAISRLLTSKQPFFNSKSSGIQFETLIKTQLNEGYNCVVFYEGIRTNGLGTIKISKKLSKQIYNLEKEYCSVHLKYVAAPQGLFSLVSHPIVLFLIALGTCSISLRVRCNPVSIQNLHSEVDVQKDLDNFLSANAAKLLDTNPNSYEQFIEFYNKTQLGNYTNVAQDQKQ